MNLQGQCHCGNIHYQLDWPDDAPLIPARRCGCSYCTRFRGAWTAHPEAALTIDCGSGEGPGRYRFGTKTADFLFCRKCGVVVAALCDFAGDIKAVLNVATLDKRRGLEFEHSDSNFDGETKQQRLDRRAERWIGRVVIE